MKKTILAIIVVVFTFFVATAQITISHLRCENLTDPIGIDITRPQLSWWLSSQQRGVLQSAYEINVSTENNAVWKTGKVLSSESHNISYNGKALELGKSYTWKVRVWDNAGKPSNWSESATWSMGLLRPEEWNAQWIGINKAFEAEDTIGEIRKLAARYLRKEFVLNKKIKNATVHISGLGLYELHLNALKVGDYELAPAATQYDKSIFYNSYDVTSQLKLGKNAIGVILGNGRFFAMRNQNPFPMQNFGFPKLFFQLKLEYVDGTVELIVSDKNWKLTARGPITENNEFDGEKYDARLEQAGWDAPDFDDKNWQPVELVTPPIGTLKAQMNEPIRITGTRKSISVKKIKPGVFIFDLGQNIVGTATLRISGKENERVSMRFAENLKADGNLYLDNIRTAQVTDSYIFKKNETICWRPKFTYHGFRYVELTCNQTEVDLSTITGNTINDDLSVNGTFRCSDSTINQIYKNAVWGIKGNYRSFPTDCPQRDERMGWLGDRAIGCTGESYVFDNENIYRKWMSDIRDSQTTDGSIPDICPAYWKLYNDNVTWDGTAIMVAEMLLDQYGNLNAVAENYESMKKWLLYMHHKYSKNGLISRDSYGDWCVPPENLKLIHSNNLNRSTDNTLLASSFFYKDTRILQRFAKLLGKTEDEKQFCQMADTLKISYNQELFVPSMNFYGNNSATSNILSLAFDLVPADKKKAVFENLVQRIETEDNGHVAVGLIGITHLQRVLTENGRADIALRFASEKEYPSWGYMIGQGATTIWELWNGNTADPAMNSGNHVMLLGDLIIWMHENVAGIKAAETGFKSLIMRPLHTNKLSYASATHISAYGIISSYWKRNQNNDFYWDIEIPANTNAKIYVPAINQNVVLEGYKMPTNVVKFICMEDDYAVFEIGSGSYHFKSKMNPIIDTKVSKRVVILPADSASSSKISVTMECNERNSHIYYTQDGTIPTEKSTQYRQPIEVSSFCILQARTFTTGCVPGYITRRSYNIFDKKQNGLNFEYYEGKWDKIPDFSLLKPLKTGKIHGFHLNEIKQREDYWGVRFRGMIKIPADGVYTFSTVSDDGTRLTINNQVIVENDGIHGALSSSGKIKLKKGKYPILLDYFEGNYGELLKVEISGPGILKQSIPISMLYFVD